MGDPVFITAYLPFFLSFSAVAGGAAIWWGIVWPRLLPWLLAISLLAGQLIRVSLPGQGGGLLLSDIAVVIAIGSLSCYLIGKKQITKLLIPLLSVSFFLLWALYSLLIHSNSLSLIDLAIASAYWIRLALYLLLIPLLMQATFSIPRFDQSLLRSLAAAGIGVIAIGVLQLLWVPNLNLFSGGWDPHRFRLVSTWLDPNLIGLFFIVLAAMMAALYSQTKHRFYLGIVAGAVMALCLTQSRSSFIAAAAGWVVILIFMRLKGSLISPHARTALRSTNMIVLLLVASVIALFPDRLLGLITKDATVELRSQALQATWHRLLEPNAVAGVGYNAYQFAAQQAGLIQDFTIHSRAGADSSLLTLWVTTGIIGVAIVGCLITLGIQVLARQALLGSTLAVASIGIIAAAGIHSQFTNSALYAHLILAIGLVVSLALTEQSKHSSLL